VPAFIVSDDEAAWTASETFTGGFGGGGGGGGGCGFVDAPPPPPHETTAIIRRRAAAAANGVIAIVRLRRRACLHPNVKAPRPHNSADIKTGAADIGLKYCPTFAALGIAAGLDVAVTVSTVARVPFAGRLPEGRLNEQEIPAGALGQANVN
jgi:hypothetical protein